MSKVKDCLILALLTVGLTTLVWLPHILQIQFNGLDFSTGFATIYRNFDGLEYVIIAKTLYFPAQIAALPQSLSANYYAAHFPGYSLLILGLAPLFGFLKAMLIGSVLSTIAAVIAFYLLVRDFKLTEHPLWLSAVFLVLPARWLIVHSVGSSEPLFIFFVIATFYCFLKYQALSKLNWLFGAAIFGALAQITRPPAVLLIIALVLYIHWQAWAKKSIFSHLRYWPLILMPLSLLLVFYWYSLSYGDFWAFFHSGDNIHLTLPPFQVFNKAQYWVGDTWLEDIVYILGIGFLAGFTLWKKKLYPMAFFVLTYFAASSLIAHRDISRYTLPAFPFVLIAFEKVLVSKEFKIVLAILALGIYLYAQNFILQNTAPVENLQLLN